MGIYECTTYNTETGSEYNLFVKAEDHHDAYEEAIEQTMEKADCTRGDVEVYTINRIE